MSVIRAAFDIGSSHHKLTVALLTASDPHPTVRILHQSHVRIPLADSLTNHNTLPSDILATSHAAIASLKKEAISHGASQFAAIATHVFRVAANGQAHLDSLSARHAMSVTILSPLEEGVLAFNTVLPTANVPSDSLVVWDSGGASTQWTHVHQAAYGVHALPVGSVSVRAAYRALPHVPTLCTWVDKFAVPIQDPVLAEKLRTACVVGIGGPSSMFALASDLVGHPVFTQRQVMRVVEDTPWQPQHALTIRPKLVLLARLMMLYRISTVTHVPANGSCVGLLLSDDARFWEPHHIFQRSTALLEAHRDEAFLLQEQSC